MWQGSHRVIWQLLRNVEEERAVFLAGRGDGGFLTKLQQQIGNLKRALGETRAQVSPRRRKNKFVAAEPFRYNPGEIVYINHLYGK